MSYLPGGCPLGGLAHGAVPGGLPGYALSGAGRRPGSPAGLCGRAAERMDGLRLGPVPHRHAAFPGCAGALGWAGVLFPAVPDLVRGRRWGHPDPGRVPFAPEKTDLRSNGLYE